MHSFPEFASMDRATGDHAILTVDSINVENNNWGAANAPGGTQSVYAANSGGGPRCGWDWDYPAVNTNDVKAYPQFIFGKKPWANSSTTNLLPCPLSPVPSIVADFSMRSLNDGKFNAAFEIWLTYSAAANGQADIADEVMFWVGQGGGPSPAGAYQTTDTLADGRTFDLWVGNIQNWRYFAIVFHAPSLAGQIDFGIYLKWLIDRGSLSSERYIASLEFGNEVWYGSGATIVDQLAITIGNAPPPVPAGGGGNPGPVVAPPPAGPVVNPPAGPALDPNKGYIHLDVPSAALVFFGGVATQAGQTSRKFVSPPISPGVNYIYQVKIVLEEPGRRVEETRDVKIRAGEETFVSFRYLEGPG